MTPPRHRPALGAIARREDGVAKRTTPCRGPIAWLGERLPWSARRTTTTVVGLVTAVALVALLNWLFPESFGPRLSFVPALVLMLVIQASFALWVRR